MYAYEEIGPSGMARAQNCGIRRDHCRFQLLQLGLNLRPSLAGCVSSHTAHPVRQKVQELAFTSDVALAICFRQLIQQLRMASSFNRYFPGPVFSPTSKLLLGRSSRFSRTSVKMFTIAVERGIETGFKHRSVWV